MSAVALSTLFVNNAKSSNSTEPRHSSVNIKNIFDSPLFIQAIQLRSIPMPVTQKRKKTADMPDSPPKRVTRARAKASDEPSTDIKTVKIMTPSAKAAAKKPKPAELAKATKRKTRADDAQETTVPEQQREKEAPEQPVKTRGKAKKVEENTGDLQVAAEAPKKTRGRQAKTAQAEGTKAEAPKTRGRVKKSEAPASSRIPTMSEPKDSEVATTKTRGRAASVKSTEAGKAPAKSANPRSTALRKKVTFQDEAEKDKENFPIGPEKPAAKATGLRAKPVRKPAATRATTRGRKAASAKAQDQTPNSGAEVAPLSPKKVVQIAKSSSISSEDELCGSKTPIRALNQSPVKPPPSSARRADGSVSRLDFTSTAPASPTKPVESSVLQSPARRPPPSPFKSGMKSSPKKVQLGEATPHPVLLFPQSTTKSTMKDSPRRGIVPMSLAQPVFRSKTPMKTTLLQSPARRPGVSPMKAPIMPSPTKSIISKPQSRQTTSPEKKISVDSTPPSPPTAASSPLRASRSAVSPIKVHKIVDSDFVVKDTVIDTAATYEAGIESPEEDSVHSASTPRSVDFADAAQHHEEEDEPSSPSPSPIKERKVTPLKKENFQTEQPEQHSTTPPDPVPATTSAFALASPAFRCAVDESDSEDELASPQKVFLATPLKKHGVSTLDFGTRSTNTSNAHNRRSSSRSAANRKSLGMTPLAVQMSTWLASSPEKKAQTTSDFPKPFPASPVFHESPAKPSFFEDQMAMGIMEIEPAEEVKAVEVGVEQDAFEPQQESQSFEEYGDENAIPVEPHVVVMPQAPQVEEQATTCTPAKIFYAQPREIHTVSKVPLRPAGDESPLRLPRKRSRSIGAPLTSGDHVPVAGAPIFVAEPSEQDERTPVKRQGRSKPTSPVKPRSSNDDSLIETPRTLRKAGSSIVLKGAVVYVDVHTSEGEDASSIFLELLTQMGARCVKQWSWNPRASIAGPADQEGSPSQSETPTSKVGITHVVFKDGGKRTMEKVRESKGVVTCVGVGWVLE